MAVESASAVAGVILCGGSSRRMGRSKASLPFGPETLLERGVRRLLENLDLVVVAASPGQIVPDFDPHRVRIVRDLTPGSGPLPGLSAALDGIPRSFESAYLTAVDMPYFSAAWLRRLTARIQGQAAAAAVVHGRLQPFAALYRISRTRAVVDRLWKEGDTRLSSVLERLDAYRIEEAELMAIDPDRRVFRDLDEPEDYLRALAEIETPGLSSPSRPTSSEAPDPARGDG